MRAPLGVVAVEDARVGPALPTTHASFQAQVGDIAQAGHQALAGERRRDVRGVAGEEARPLEKRLRLAGVKAIDRRAFDRDARRRRTRARAGGAPIPAAPSARASSPGCSMNSQRWRPPGATMCGVGRRGSQMNSTWSIGSGTSVASTISQSCAKVWPSNSSPSRRPHQRARAVAPTRKRARACHVPAIGILQLRMDESAVVDQPSSSMPSRTSTLAWLRDLGAQDLLRARAGRRSPASGGHR